MQLSDIEKQFLAKISAVSMKDQTTIKDVLFAILTCITLESYHKNESEIVIPLIAKLKFKYSEESSDKGYLSDIEIEAEPMPALINEFLAIKNGEEPNTKRHFRKQNRIELGSGLKIDFEE